MMQFPAAISECSKYPPVKRGKTKPKAEDIFDPSFLPSTGERQVQ
jgi:hypothetical protein